MENTIRFGIIGCGDAAKIHVRSIQGERVLVRGTNNGSYTNLFDVGKRAAKRLLGRNDYREDKIGVAGINDAEIVAISDVNRERLNWFSRTYDIQDSYGDYNDLLASNEIDAVIICTPPNLHPKITIEAARRRKHVFCEKPMALTSEDCCRMIEATEKAGVILQIGYVLRFSSNRERLRQAIQHDEIGRPVFWREIYNPRGLPAKWVYDQNVGGGALWENSHMLDFLRYIFGDPAIVFAIGGRYKPDDTSAIDTVGILMTFPTGDKALLTDSYALKGYSWNEIGRRKNQLQIDIVGSKGFIQFPERDLSEKLTIQIYGEPQDQIEISQWSNEWGADGYRRELEHFCECVRQGKSSRVPGAEGLRTVQLAETAQRSIQTGKVYCFAENGSYYSSDPPGITV